MGHYVRYQIEFNTDMTKGQREKVAMFVNDNFDDVDIDDDYLYFEGQHPYSFDIREFMQKENVKGNFVISAWYQERDPDEVWDYANS